MIFTGMIYQYNTTEGIGLIMLSNGETKEFSSNDWTDTIDLPAIGQKVSYESNSNRLEIKVLRDEEKNISTNTIEELTNFDDSIQHFIDKGFKKIKDLGSDESRVITLRRYSMDEHAEATIKQSNSKIIITQTLNGKAI